MNRTICPSCEQTFDTEKGMKVHHATVHGKSLSGVRVECDWCGEHFRKPCNRYERDDHHFCCRECSSQWRTENFNGEANPHWKGGKVETECDQCGEALEFYPSNEQAYDAHWCSEECESEWKSENMSGEDAPAWSGGKVEAECHHCGDTFTRHRAELERAERTFCSFECRQEWWEETSAGSYGPFWELQRAKALWRDGYECRRCGVTQEEHRGEYDASLHVHHIEPRGSTHDLVHADRLENLVTLCVRCHYKVEGTDYDPTMTDEDHKLTQTEDNEVIDKYLKAVAAGQVDDYIRMGRDEAGA